MAIDAAMPVSREIALAGAVPQASLTRRDRELQVEEGQPPIEVAEAELEALRWRKREELREKWQKRQRSRLARRRALDLKTDAPSESEARAATPEGEALAEDEAQNQPGQELQKSAETFEEETGMLLDDRS